MTDRSRYGLLIAFSMLALGVTGCGGVKNPVAGRVTSSEGGAPPVGLVQFSPDLDMGNDGPTVTLLLKNGEFSSAKEGLSMRPGEHKVTVMVVPQGAEYRPTRERRFHVNVPQGGTNDLVFDVSPKPRGSGKKVQDPDGEDD